MTGHVSVDVRPRFEIGDRANISTGDLIYAHFQSELGTCPRLELLIIRSSFVVVDIYTVIL